MNKCATIQNAESNKCIGSNPYFPSKRISIPVGQKEKLLRKWATSYKIITAYDWWLLRFDLWFNWRFATGGHLGRESLPDPCSWTLRCWLHDVIYVYWVHTSPWAASCNKLTRTWRGVQVPCCLWLDRMRSQNMHLKLLFFSQTKRKEIPLPKQEIRLILKFKITVF